MINLAFTILTVINFFKKKVHDKDAWKQIQLW